jgi:orotidine-5'-phosphate decarboxylase
MNRLDLINSIKNKSSFLCVGLDVDLNKIPSFLLNHEDPIFEFNKRIIDATLPYTVAYKPNLAFYEAYGINGLKSYEKTIAYLNNLSEKVFIIADAKRGDIGNTSAQYAKSFFQPENPKHAVNAVTVAPYMGEDSVSPFLGFENKWVILLALTSNKGASDFQFERLESGERVFERVLRISSKWANEAQMMYVVGATQATMLSEVRAIVPNHFLLVPGVGAQGGSLQEVAQFGMTKDCGLLINASRSILYASNGDDFADKAAEEASSMQKDMKILLSKYNVI